MTSRKASDGGLRGAFESFVHSQAGGSVLLIAATVVAVAWANSPWQDGYARLLATRVGVSWAGSAFALSLQHWVNDLLMAVFFFVVGLEIKREIVVGELSSLRKAALPLVAAAGGMIVPAALYAAFNAGRAGSHGWGVPMATDIAFAIGILTVFGARAPVGVKVFLTALAIADDLGAVAVIAFFYSGGIRWAALAAAALLLGLLVLAGRAGIRRPGVYLALAGGVWVAVFASGVHATIAGILVALLVPVRAPAEPEAAIAVVDAKLAELRELPLSRASMIAERSQLETIEVLHRATGDLRPPGLTLEQFLHPVVAFGILPVFALCNAGVTLAGGFGSNITSAPALGVIVGLLIGKPLGVLGASWLAVRAGWARLPEGVTWRLLRGVACLAGIGFTMSLFIAELAFADPELIADAKVGIIVGSVLAGVVGSLIVRASLARPRPASR